MVKKELPKINYNQLNKTKSRSKDKHISITNELLLNTPKTPSYKKPFQTKPVSKQSSMREARKDIDNKFLDDVPELKSKEITIRGDEIEQKLDLIFD